MKKKSLFNSHIEPQIIREMLKCAHICQDLITVNPQSVTAVGTVGVHIWALHYAVSVISHNCLHYVMRIPFLKCVIRTV